MEHINWQINKSYSECSKYILENEVDCDVSFNVEDQEVIKAHKFILRMRSPVFDRMFNGGYQESDTDPVIPDVSPAAFRTLLRYCYYECLDIEGDVALSVLYAATKYMLPILQTAARKTLIKKLDGSKIWQACKYSTDVDDKELHAGCMKYLKGNLSETNILDVIRYAVKTRHKELSVYCMKHLMENLSESNILDIIKYAVNIGDEQLHATCKDHLKKHLGGCNIWEVYNYAINKEDTVHQHCREYFEGDVVTVRAALHAEEFLNIHHEVLLDVLHINDKVDEAVAIEYTPGISISEIELFKACNGWADAECLRQDIEPTGANKRTVLGECLSLIRFPTMLPKDLATVVYPTDIITQAGILNIGKYIHRDPGSECQVDFPSGKRQFVVTPRGSTSGSGISTVYIESAVRVMLTRLWIIVPGSYTVTVKNAMSHRSWSMVLDTKYGNHVRSNKLISYIDIEPQVLEEGTRYQVTAERTRENTGKQPVAGVQHNKVPTNLYPYKEVNITRDRSEPERFYGFTLYLV